jgi:hypothetical protein
MLSPVKAGDQELGIANLPSPYERHSTERVRRRRKTCKPLHNRIVTGHLFVDLRQQVVILDSETVRLTRLQYRVLALLVKHGGEAVSRTIILKQIWGDVPKIRVSPKGMLRNIVCHRVLPHISFGRGSKDSPN